jgi:hypothetical protein
LAIGFALYLFDFLELPTQAFVDVIVGTVDGVLPDGVDLTDIVEDLRVLMNSMFLLPLQLQLQSVTTDPRLFLLHRLLYSTHPVLKLILRDNQS